MDRPKVGDVIITHKYKYIYKIIDCMHYRYICKQIIGPYDKDIIEFHIGELLPVCSIYSNKLIKRFLNV